MSFGLLAVLAAVASSDATCADGSDTCRSVQAQDNLLLQTEHSARVQRPSDLSLVPEWVLGQEQVSPSEVDLLEEGAESSEVTSRCGDLDGNCAYYRKQGYCNSDHMKQHCAKTCGACGGSAPAPSSRGATIKFVSYNLFWWNAFDQNPQKSDSIVANIKNMQADSLGLQECNRPGDITYRTSNMYNAVSPFKDNQGVMVKPGVFTVEAQGSRNLQARGKWGDRYVTWVKLRHIASGRSLFHFNTHWCVHSGNGYTCDGGVRHTGAKNMLQAIRQVAGTSSPTVITGDFNAGMGEPGVQELLRNGFALARNSGVDAILYSQRHWSVVRAYAGSAANSDHSPVIVELQFVR